VTWWHNFIANPVGAALIGFVVGYAMGVASQWFDTKEKEIE
jgi:hypothetical protein